MKDHHAIVIDPRTEEIPAGEDPAAPKVGRWYWVTWGEDEDDDLEEGPAHKPKDKKRWFGCVVRVGTNYALLKGLGIRATTSLRVHFDEFFSVCEHVPNAQAVIDAEVMLKKNEVIGLMQEVKEITAKLAIGSGGPSLGSGATETQALALRTQDRPVDEYKTALVHARDESLPELFEKIKEANETMGMWMSAPLLPLEAQASSLEPAIESIKERLFSVELYAGLVEQVVQIKDGAPAALTEKVHVVQRRAYMDEECLAQYEVGGMTFRELGDFDQWLCRPSNLDRLLPFPRTIVAFKVRRKHKDREVYDYASYLTMMTEQKLDALTFLYIRNGQRVYRLGTEIEFDEDLFPDMRPDAGKGILYAKHTGRGPGGYNLISKDEWRAMRAADRESRKRYKREEAAVKHLEWIKRPHIKRASNDSEGYDPFTKDSVWYDDIVKSLATEAQHHNRLVLVLQGLLDRSPALHPHPPWSLWRQDSFEVAITLVYDSTRALVAGERPDFEAYRAKCNASARVGSILLGQERIWQMAEAEKENDRLSNETRGRRIHSYTTFSPQGNPGPGKFAHAVSIKGGVAGFQWNKKRRAPYGEDRGEVGVRFSAPLKELFHVEAYKPGDFRLFFSDPRTRAEYLQWAPILLEAEEFHAGNRKVAPVVPLAPKKPRGEPSYEYQMRKSRKALVGKLVRNIHPLETKGDKKYPKGLLWRVTDNRGADFTIRGVDAKGKEILYDEDGHRAVSAMSMSDLLVVEEP